MPNGWIVLDKPLGMGSTQAVAAAKRNLRAAGHGKVKVGHGGTLDPLATGVLPIAVGEATKLAGRLLDATKEYAFTIAFGTETDTLDAEGEVVTRSQRRPPFAAIAAILPSFVGEIEQVPPAFSALKIDGQRAYRRARSGEAVEMAARCVTIHSLALANARNEEAPLSAFATTRGRPDPYDPAAPLELAEQVTLVACVSKGTYIRSLARDIAHALGTCGHVVFLRRLKAGPFSEAQAISLDRLNDLGNGAPIEEILLPMRAGLDDIPALSLTPDEAGAVRQGRTLSGLAREDGTYWAQAGDIPVALMQVENGEARVLRGFNLSNHDVAE
ncbi:tRNA pseudouridine(55) synthase TruB [Croceicoccus sp. F390]|uniref:tRNA pseudouridine synthase B n=1 Tax=Croceicoccus esteveae TaxID=3075597 RepID=A0ABU2ZJU8_9SPHN|nr:tRNA pseudouridine(55) synthase TruB [Croceicoccus sp. F390]MDT0576881.1 tRNA pseudouridine(55) synthase TruB [Croceicoccus sp. F390]